jgi:hypothetical protein
MSGFLEDPLCEKLKIISSVRIAVLWRAATYYLRRALRKTDRNAKEIIAMAFRLKVKPGAPVCVVYAQTSHFDRFDFHFTLH